MKQLMMGNEAIGRAAIEAGVSVVAAYPGTPSSEIPSYVARHAKEHGIFMEYSTNEKVALEVCIGTSWSGLRAMTTMKHVGLNVASDALMTLTYAGVEGGLVIVSADDPYCHSSQNEQDNRYYSLLANLPTLEPSSPQEAYEMTKDAFDLSEELGLPIMLRPTTRTCHCRADVETGDVREKNEGPDFKRDVTHRVTIPAHARKLHPELLEKIERTREVFEKSGYNSVEGSGNWGIVGSGISYAYVKEALGKLGGEISLFKLGTLHPLPKKILLDFISDKERVLVVEEMEPILEDQLKTLAFDNGVEVEIVGKDYIPRVGELNTSIVTDGISRAFGLRTEAKEEGELGLDLPPRPPMLCPGCPHRAAFYCIKKTSKDWIKPSDIGCYTLGMMPPLNAVDSTFCMGSSIGISCGFAAAGNKEIIATIGDSTFFHTGLPPMVDAVYNRHNITVVILDNRTTAMTGHQPNPGSGLNATMDPAPMIDLVKLCKALGTFTQEVDPFDLEATEKAIIKANEHEGPAVIVSKRPCVLIEKTKRGETGYRVDKEKCKGCKICINQLGCPAMLFNADEKKAEIDDLLCANCGVCAQVCPYDAIEM
ncbi:MAG TPA: indolepyruvate ferredoxin oxidoreductase subunit alpha [Candidatus Methanofastidiosa archaeon]|nr:indolepyruvate ferredoxin oxidoreductase subunit alpha [Candidatus Methanofastidiosa archaeon]